MDFIVTEAGIEAAVAGGLIKLSAEDCRARLAALATERGLPRRQSSSNWARNPERAAPAN